MNTKLHCFVTLTLLAMPAVVQAQFNFTTNNGTLTITQYTGPGGAVTIPNSTNGLPIIGVGSAAFYQVFNLTSVTVGTNVTTIGDNAFFQCTSLSSASIPASVTNIGAGPFVDCQSLTVISLSPSNLYYSVTNNLLFNKTQTSLIQYPGGIGGSYTLPAAVTNIGEAFIGNTLSSISVNSTNLYYSSTNGVLFDKSQTVLISYPGVAGGSYTVPGSVTTIASASFEYSPSVASVAIGTNVTSIGDFAFYDCASLNAISVNSTNAFYSSTNGVLFDKNQTTLIQYPSGLGGSFAVPGTVTNIGAGAFGDAFGLTGIVIPNSVTSIGEQAFYSCERLADVTFGNRVASIGEQAFLFCTNLTHIEIPDSVTNIARFAFYDCPRLASLTIGSSVASIGAEAFAGCQSLTSVCFKGNEPSDGGSIFFFDFALSTICHASGSAGWGATYDGIPTATCVGCVRSAPQLAIVHSGTNVILTWPTNFTGFTLQSTTNLVAPSVWGTVSPPAVVVNGQNTVTNFIVGASKFYRLMGP